VAVILLVVVVVVIARCMVSPLVCTTSAGFFAPDHQQFVDHDAKMGGR
jgi:hypothetical protein